MRAELIYGASPGTYLVAYLYGPWDGALRGHHGTPDALLLVAGPGASGVHGRYVLTELSDLPEHLDLTSEPDLFRGATYTWVQR